MEETIETGSVGPGSVAGSGSVEAGAVAGRDLNEHTTAQDVSATQSVAVMLDSIARTAQDESVALLANLTWALHQEDAAQRRQDVAELRRLLLENGMVSRVERLEASLETMANLLTQLRAHPRDCPYLKMRDQAGEEALYRRETLKLVTNGVIAVALVALVALLVVYVVNGGTL